MVQRYGVSEEFMEKYIPKPWNWLIVFHKLKLPKKIKIKYMDEFLKVCNASFSASEYFWYDFTDEELELFIDKIDSWGGLYKYNKNITENFIIKYIDKPWGFSHLSINQMNKNKKANKRKK